MAGPVVFISHFRVKEDALEEYRAFARRGTAQLEEQKPRTVAFLIYEDQAAGRLSIVHAFPDSEAMDAHFEGAAERAQDAYRFIEPAGWEIYGQPSQGALAMMRQSAAAAGVELTVRPDYVVGFLRLGIQ